MQIRQARVSHQLATAVQLLHKWTVLARPPRHTPISASQQADGPGWCSAACTSQGTLRKPAPRAGVPAADAPPFTKLSTPVYSLSSRGPPASGGGATLNIVTYASPIAIQPVRKYALGLYVGTQSWQNVRATGRAALQVGCLR